MSYRIFSHRKYIKAHLAEDPPRAIGYLNYEELWKFRGLQNQSKSTRRRHRSEEKALDKESIPYKSQDWRVDPVILFTLLGMAQNHSLKYKGASSNETLTVCHFYLSLMSRMEWAQNSSH